MKKNLAAIVFIAIFFLIAMSTHAQCFHDDDSDHSAVEMVKGTVLDLNHDGSWDFVTFGLKGLDSYRVSYVELLGENETSCGNVENPFHFPFYGISWFLISLKDINTPPVFYLKVHIIKSKGSNNASTNNSSKNNNSVTSPNDPEETILIVKYP